MKVVKNACFGGFSLSLKAQREYLKRKGKEAFAYVQTKYSHRDGVNEYTKVDIDAHEDSLFVDVLTKDLGEKIDELTCEEGEYLSSSDIPRNDPDLIAVIEEMGSGHGTGASGQCANLEIVEIPDGIEYEIDEYDGAETIREKHRSW